MRNKMVIAGCFFVFAMNLASVVKADNPIIQTKYTADPAPMVHNDTVFLYTSHDEDNADVFLMKNWLVYTSTDMVNWTDHGQVASLYDFKWADEAITGWGGFENGAWAPQCIEKDGKYYMYCPVQGRGIGVLVANSPMVLLPTQLVNRSLVEITTALTQPYLLITMDKPIFIGETLIYGM